jgi:cation transport regulator ChaB
MPYQSNKDLPDSVKDNLPNHAQREAFDNAWDQYQDPAKGAATNRWMKSRTKWPEPR